MPTHAVVTDIYQKVAEFLRAEKRFALAVVMNDAGSTPRKAGTKAIIDEDGSIWGTIGGGLLESDARKLAVQAIASGKPTIFDFKFAGKSAGEDDPVCGGNMRILIDPTATRYPTAYFQIAQALAERRRGVFLRIVQEGKVGTAFYTRGCIKDEDDRFIDAVRRASGGGAVYFLKEEQQVEGLAEPILPAPLLLVGGGGHVGQALARAAHLIGFDVVVVDDREEFSDPSLFGEGIKCRRGAFRDVLFEFPIDEDTYVALVGRGHKVDGKALLSCLNSPAAYIGMMGSRRKVALVKKQFIDDMLIDEEGWKRIHAPIGLDIGAETVPEIAASIVAQLIEVRRRTEAPKMD